MIIKILVKIIILFVYVGVIPILAYNIKDLIVTLIRSGNYKKNRILLERLRLYGSILYGISRL